jgi:cell division protein FtsZ
MVNITGGPDLSLTRVNELMSAVTEEFGREAHVIMGAVIDEAMQGRVEVCVLGATDPGGRTYVRARPQTAPPMSAAPRRTERAPAAPAAAAPAPAAPAPAAGSARSAAARNQQSEFGFGGAEAAAARGEFDKSERNLFEGQDLDVPTYLRRGIKVVV